VLDDIMAIDGGRTGSRSEHRVQHVDRGRLARAVRPQEPENLAWLDDEIDFIDGDEVSKLADQSVRLGGVHSPPNS
jgi:hypothetical protein